MTTHCPTCRCVPYALCGCGHLEEFHNYGKRGGVTVRTGCSWTDGAGRDLNPCPCPLFTPEEMPDA